MAVHTEEYFSLSNRLPAVLVGLGSLALGWWSIGAFILPNSSVAQTGTSSSSSTSSSLSQESSSVVSVSSVAGDVKLKNIVETASANPDFSTLVTALKAADLTGALEGTGPFTVFAPTNSAFEKLPAGTVENLLKPENKTTLQNILKYHVVSGSVLSTDLKQDLRAKTLADTVLSFDLTNGVVVNGTSTVTTPDLKQCNGVIHGIDTVLLPPATQATEPVYAFDSIATNVTNNKSFSTLLANLKTADLATALGGSGTYTVFAPDNASFDKLSKETKELLSKSENVGVLADILKNHVVLGDILSTDITEKTPVATLTGNVFYVEKDKDGLLLTDTNGATLARVTNADLKSSNGVIHTINNVIVIKK
jgi:transforming growth factor-beta-induced protein